MFFRIFKKIKYTWNRRRSFKSKRRNGYWLKKFIENDGELILQNNTNVDVGVASAESTDSISQNDETIQTNLEASTEINNPFKVEDGFFIPFGTKLSSNGRRQNRKESTNLNNELQFVQNSNPGFYLQNQFYRIFQD